jgi:hypothetical protein
MGPTAPPTAAARPRRPRSPRPVRAAVRRHAPRSSITPPPRACGLSCTPRPSPRPAPGVGARAL